jgi:hypothetical protein
MWPAHPYSYKNSSYSSRIGNNLFLSKVNVTFVFADVAVPHKSLRKRDVFKDFCGRQTRCFWTFEMKVTIASRDTLIIIHRRRLQRTLSCICVYGHKDPYDSKSLHNKLYQTIVKIVYHNKS